MGDDVTSFLRSFQRIGQLASELHADAVGQGLMDVLTEHMGVPPERTSVVSKEIVPHRFADYDVALELLVGPDARLVGLGGGDYRHHTSLADMLGNRWQRASVGQIDWANVPANATETRRVMALGLRLFTYRGQPAVVLQRRRSRMHSEGQGVIEVLCPDVDVANALIDEATELATTKSLLRGNVISLQMSGYGPEGDGYSFVPRPDLPEQQVILPAGLLERVATHVVGVADHAAALRRHGQHLKRGVLLYGPPGTGKTHTVRHLISRTPEHTVILLTGRTLNLIGAATAIARNLQPAIVVLEDCDLVAMDRSFGDGGGPLLFEVLDALDGLASDSDVVFLLTTNRVDDLERALVQRPGRIDLAVEVPRPGRDERRRLLALYRRDIDFSDAVLDDHADRSEGHTASFFKELVRRAVLDAARTGAEPTDAHLVGAFETLLSDQESLSRNLISGDTLSSGQPSGD